MSTKPRENPILDENEQDIEDNFDNLKPVENLKQRMLELKQASQKYLQINNL